MSSNSEHLQTSAKGCCKYAANICLPFLKVDRHHIQSGFHKNTTTDEKGGIKRNTKYDFWEADSSPTADTSTKISAV